MEATNGHSTPSQHGSAVPARCHIESLPAEILIHILKRVQPHDAFELALTSTTLWRIATNPQLWRQLCLSISDPLPPHLAATLQGTLTRPQGRNTAQANGDGASILSSKGKHRMTDNAENAVQPSSKDEWRCWASLALARDHAVRHVASAGTKPLSRRNLGEYSDTLAIMAGMLETRAGRMSPSPTADTFTNALFPDNLWGRQRFRTWIFPRSVLENTLSQPIDDANGEDGASRKRRRVETEHARTSSRAFKHGSSQNQSHTTQQHAAELHCLHGPVYTTEPDLDETVRLRNITAAPGGALIDTDEPFPSSSDGRQPQGTMWPCSTEKCNEAQMLVYDSGNFGRANQWGPLRPWISNPADTAADASTADGAAEATTNPPTIVVPGINAPPQYALVGVHTLQGAAVAALMLDHLGTDSQGAEAEQGGAPTSSSATPMDLSQGSNSLADPMPTTAALLEDVSANPDEEGEEDEDLDFVPSDSDDDAGSDASGPENALELAMTEASARRCVTVNKLLAERREESTSRGTLPIKEIDWRLVEAVMLVMHWNIAMAQRERGWGYHLPVALFESSHQSGAGSSSGASFRGQTSANRHEGGIMTLERRLRQAEEEIEATTSTLDGPLTRNRRRTLLDSGLASTYWPLEVPTGWDKSHGPDPRLEPSANPRDWAGVEGVWIGTYAFQDFPVFCAYQTALTRGVPFNHMESDVVGDCLHLCLRVLPEGELLPPADEEICAQPLVGGMEGLELLPDTSKASIGEHAEVLPPLRIQGHAVQYTHEGEERRRSTIYGMVRPVYGPVSSTRDVAKTALGEDAVGSTSAPASSGDDYVKQGRGEEDVRGRLVIKGFHWNLCHRYLNQNSWSLSGIQPGGLGSRLPILGIWTDADRNAAQPSPCGPWMYYRVGNRRWEDVRAELYGRS